MRKYLITVTLETDSKLFFELESESKNEAINKSLAWCIKESYPIKEIKADDILSTIGIIKL